MSRVEIGWPSWVGLGVGVLAGGVLGGLFYKGILAWSVLAPLMAGRGTAVVFVGAGVLGALGWLAGALVHLFATPTPSSDHELELKVPPEKLSDVKYDLSKAGAVAVIVTPNGGSEAARPSE